MQTFSEVATAVAKVLRVVSRGGKPSHRFSVVRVGKSRDGNRVPSAEAAIIAQRTGVDLTDSRNLEAVIAASRSTGSTGVLYSDGLSVWDAIAEASRKAAAKAHRDTSTAIRNDYRAAIVDAVSESLDL